MSPRINRPAGAKDPQWNYVLLARSYMKVHPETKSLKGITISTLKAAVDKEHSTGGGNPAGSASASDKKKD